MWEKYLIYISGPNFVFGGIFSFGGNIKSLFKGQILFLVFIQFGQS